MASLIGARDKIYLAPGQSDEQPGYAEFDSEDEVQAIIPVATRIMTKSRFSFMELPVEIRLKIYSYLLLSPEEHISIPRKTASSTFDPAVSILRTCKLLNEEATPLLYSHNNFLVNIGNYILYSPLPVKMVLNMSRQGLMLMILTVSKIILLSLALSDGLLSLY
ncbi:hypothetical protein F5884DRAFT_184362 [Xylogone sp. PMI_703]|nr:hypothetical protein F5884DRAFT_184362 [Xylogone sp. PMI_703]